MDKISAFISYSSKQKNIGGKFKSYLENYCGYNTFIAHEDIPGSSIWQDEIIKFIKTADFFIPLISQEFKQSPFTDQETGIAICEQKKIIPIKLSNINPYGFIEKYQAFQYKEYPNSFYGDNIDKLTLIIAQIGLLSETKCNYHQKALNSIVDAFCTSKSFNITNATIQVLCMCNDLSHSHVKLIIKALTTNSQIKNAYGLPTLKEYLHKKYLTSID